MKKVSIIIPAYNAEDYISDCLEAVCQQTYAKIEVLVVNDGSKDRTEEIVGQYVRKDTRIIMLSNANHGVSYSRNYAISRSTGDYIAFIDADDIVSTDFIQTLVEILEKNDADISTVAIAKGSVFSSDLFSDGESIEYMGEEILLQLFGVFEGFLCNKLYRADIINEFNIRLKEDISISEDLLFNVDYLLHSNIAVFCEGKKYFYRQNSESAINRLNNPRWFESLTVYKNILELLNEYPMALKKTSFLYSMILCEAKYRVKYLDGDNNALTQNIHQENRRMVSRYNSYSYKQRIKLFAFNHFPGMVIRYKRRNLHGN